MFHADTKHSTARRLALLASATGIATLLTAGPAFAHVEVESDKAQALAENVGIGFEAESESSTAGITKLRVVLPEGIEPADVTYGEGPKGWRFTAADDGYTVEGPAVKAGENAVYSIVVKQLPDVKELAFKTLQTYSDGRVDRWIELDESGENPAPVLSLKASAPGAESAASTPSETESRAGITAVLAHVVVIARVRSYGLGSALVRRFTDDAAAAGCARLGLVTAAGPDGAGPYYERLGWQYAGETRTPEGRALLAYEYDLTFYPRRGTAQ
ncbi:GNAT family N-acetyltransferase [Streptomyces shenzhenensis]|uniref:GNAT family N-acetyltransferase n=1 Tax=Streptomyces shenzhenensis TaxID=943815 RepID=UPI00368A73CD